MPTNRLTRRQVLQSAAALPAFSLLPSNAFGANDQVRLAVIGLRGRGRELIGSFKSIPGVQIAALCDVDENILRQEAAKHAGAFTTTDLRRIYDRPDIDAVVIANPNHWHTLAAIWALQAGKHVYVEKPVSHNIFESRQLAAFADKSTPICAAGFQNRSDTGLVPFFADLHAGNYGKVIGVRGLCYRNRTGIGRRPTPLTPPEGLDYDLWLGPAFDQPIYRNQFHYDWHWMWSFGNGDVGNQGPHEMDLLRWALQDPMHLPDHVQSVGGRFAWNDAGETPNVLITNFDYNGVTCTFEVNDVAFQGKTTNFKGVGVGVVVATENGEFRGGRGGGRFYDRQGKEVKYYPGDSGATHYRNFIEALRSGDRTSLRSPVGSAAVSSSLSHLANISYRAGHTADADQVFELAQNFKSPLNRHGDHLSSAGVDFREELWTVGPNLNYNNQTHQFQGEAVSFANHLLKPRYRAPYSVPETV